jgi:predicted dehydrogenase
MKYRTAIIGCGKIGSEFADDPRIKDIYTHGGAYSSCPDTDLVAVCDTDIEKSQKCGKRWGVKDVYIDFRTMIEESRPEIVSVCTPDVTHYQIIRDVMEYDCIRAIFAEKPLALNISEAKELIRLVQEKNIMLSVNYFRRYAPNHRDLKHLIQNKTNIGEIQTVSGYYTKGILHNGSHWLDLARFLIGEIKLVQGFPGTCINTDDPTLSAYLLFNNGASGFLFGCDEKMFDIFEMDIIGTKGRIRIIDSGHTIEKYHVENDPNYSGYRALAPWSRDNGGLTDPLLHAVEDIVTCLDEGGVPMCSGRDGLEALRIGLSIRDSALTGKIIAFHNE